MGRGPNKWIRWPPLLSEKLRENLKKAARTLSVSRAVVRSQGGHAGAQYARMARRARTPRTRAGRAAIGRSAKEE